MEIKVGDVLRYTSSFGGVPEFIGKTVEVLEILDRGGLRVELLEPISGRDARPAGYRYQTDNRLHWERVNLSEVELLFS